MTAVARPAPAIVRLGLSENLAQFALLVIVNAFVGAMVGMESIWSVLRDAGWLWD